MICAEFARAMLEAGITPPHGCGHRAAELAHVLRATPLPVNWRKGQHHALACRALGPLINGGGAVLNHTAREYQLTPLGAQWLAQLEAANLLVHVLTTAEPLTGTAGGQASKITLPFIDYLRALVVAHAGNRSAAIRALIDSWHEGAAVPGYGTWKDWHQATQPGVRLPKYCRGYPHGWSDRNLRYYLTH